MTNQFKILIWIFILGSNAHAGNEGGHSGNGGDAVVCYMDKDRQVVRSIELFDFWEKRQEYPYFKAVSLGDASLPVPLKLEMYFDRLKQMGGASSDLKVLESMRQYAVLLANDIQSYLVDEVPQIDDENSTLLPSPPCFKEQFAVQVGKPGPTERRFKVKRSLYNHPKMTNDHRAGLIFHEAVYRNAILKYGDTNSNRSRLLNAMLATNSYESFLQSRPDDLIGLLGKIEFGLDNLRTVYIPGKIEPMLLWLDRIVNLNDQAIVLKDYYYEDSNLRVDLRVGDRAGIWEHSGYHRVGPYRLLFRNNQVQIKIPGVKLHPASYPNKPVGFGFESMDLKTPVSIQVYHVEPIVKLLPSGTVRCKAGGSQHLFAEYHLEDYSFKGCYMENLGAELKAGPNTLKIGAPTWVSFYRNGTLRSVRSNNNFVLKSLFRSEPIKFVASDVTEGFDGTGILFNSAGLVTQGPTFHEENFENPLEFKFTFNGDSNAYSRGTIQWLSPGKAKVTRVFTNIKPKIGKMFVLAGTKYPESSIALNGICSKVLGHRGARGYGNDWSWRFLTWNVGNAEFFFDPVTLTIVEKKDEPVTVYDPHQDHACEVPEAEVSFDQNN